MGIGFGVSLLAFLFMIGPLILIHEAGHFWAARLNNVTVEEFGIGFPPRMLTLFERKGTKYTLNWLPLGGFMRPAGEDDPSVEGGLASAPKLARFSVLVAGPGANFVAAFLLIYVMFLVGAQEVLGAKIVEVEPNSPADTAGLQVDDLILQADDLAVETYPDLITYIHTHAGQPIMLTIQRGDEIIETEITPRTEWPEDRGPTGITLTAADIHMQRYGPIAAIGRTFEELGDFAKTLIELPTYLMTGQVEARELRPISIVGISQLGGQAINTSITENALWPIMRLAAYISLALGITNLLPLPALDGGRILFILIEAVRGKRVEPEREMVIHFIGFALLVTAMVVFVYLDIVDPLVVAQ